MKIFYKTEVDILESNIKVWEDYTYRVCNTYDSGTIILTEEHIKALKAGKMLAWCDDRIAQFVTMEKISEKI